MGRRTSPPPTRDSNRRQRTPQQRENLPDGERITLDGDMDGGFIRKVNIFLDDLKRKIWSILWWPIAISLIWFGTKLLVWISINL